jgi:hypothetical protein
MFNLMIGFISVILHALVVYYGWRMYKLGPAVYWSHAWLQYSFGNLLILIRRIIGLYLACTCEMPVTSSVQIIWPVTAEYVLQILVSIFLLIFGMSLKKLYDKYLRNGMKIDNLKQKGQEKNKEK